GDGMIGIANLDDDPEGEVIVSSYNTVRALDTDGKRMWGPYTPTNANIVSPSAIGDIDLDGRPEIIVAGGNQLIALNHDGTELWSVPVQDESGATGASIFDFEGDGIPEVVYIDEIQMIAVDGRTGATKFYSDEHKSATMMDYPIVADVDGDDHAEIVVCHQGFGLALSVYGDEDDSWRPARPVWNQHAYSITNIADDFSIPPTVPPPFTVHNTWHAALSEPVTPTGAVFDGPVDVGAQLLGYCDVSCAADVPIEVFGRLVNVSPGVVPAGSLKMTLYAYEGTKKILVGTEETTADVASGTTGGDVSFLVPRDLAASADRFELVADDIGGGIGLVSECAEANNTAEIEGPLCAPWED
ncbi:MAG TPA: VCBS repeat-containing protein, partial [Myxococcota bacterium]|nr:VCBS repeat-containing protein [Myxococcota bacterium]